MQETIFIFTKKYCLTRSEVIVEIEKVFSEVFSRRYGFEVMIVLQSDDHLEVVAYDRVDGVLLQKSIDVTRTRGWNTIKRHLEKNLEKASVLKQTRQYKYYERELRWGEITGNDPGRNYHVEIEIIPGETMTAVCPLEASDDDYLFASRKYKDRPLQIQTVNKLIKTWTKSIMGLKLSWNVLSLLWWP